MSRVSFLILALFLVVCPRAASAATGEEIYRQKCARCHGPRGEGSKEHNKPLAGDLSLPQLGELIAETMPEDDPGRLSKREARSVASYVFDNFYSPIAAARRRPPRLELARLTVNQYRRAVADLVSGFRPPTAWGEQRGLNGEYYRGRALGRGGRAANRIDAQIAFDFGVDAPVKEIKEPHAFTIRWTGSLLAPETGEYDIVIRTEHAARMWLNGKRPLIDAWVKSGKDKEFKASRFLIGGRVYPLRLEFSKAIQGVNKKRKNPESKPASIALMWRRPRGGLETIPARSLAPKSAPESFACSTPFPPDDRSYGWVRGASISKAWNEATTNAAMEAAEYIAPRIDEFAGARRDSADRIDKLRAFCRGFAERAFRQPLDDALARKYVDAQFEAAEDPEEAVRRVVLLVLKSPRFLFREVGSPGPFHVAARLSFGLWDSLPDEQLWRAAAEGRLSNKSQVAEQAQRMVADRRARPKLREFLTAWLKMDSDYELAKDAEQFAQFDAAAAADLRNSLELFLEDVVWSESSDYRLLLLSDEMFLNERLAKIYGVEHPGGEGFAKIRVDSARRAGILTHPFLLASFADNHHSSPIHRGVFLARDVLGRLLRPPPVAVAPLSADLHPSLTTRERVVLQTKAANCMVCHGTINPLGFALEGFDAIGRYRKLDRGKPVDSRGSYQTRDGKTVTFRGPRELAEFLAGSRESHEAFAEQLFHHLVQQPIRAYGPQTLEKLNRSFQSNRFSIRRLAAEAMVASALIGRETDLNDKRPETKKKTD